MAKQKVLIASDHAGYKLKEFLKASFAQQYKFIDLGTNATKSVDYPDFGSRLAAEIAKKTAEIGVLVCGSGIGISIAANREPKVRAALCYNEEAAELSRKHNNANVLCLGARMTNEKEALKTFKKFFSTEFEGGRHEIRVEKLS